MKEIIKEWKKEAFGRSFDETTVFHVEEDKIFIITKYPGLFIGYHGALIDKFQSKLDKEVVFVDLGVGDVKEF